MMALFTRLRRSVALFICPGLDAKSAIQRALTENDARNAAPQGARRFRFKTEECQTGEPTRQEERLYPAAPQGVERMRSAKADLLTRHRNRLREMHSQRHATPVEHAKQEHAATLPGQKDVDSLSSDRSASHQGHAGDHQ